jgi:hypothetical protein
MSLVILPMIFIWRISEKEGDNICRFTAILIFLLVGLIHIQIRGHNQISVTHKDVQSVSASAIEIQVCGHTTLTLQDPPDLGS